MGGKRDAFAQAQPTHAICIGGELQIVRAIRCAHRLISFNEVTWFYFLSNVSVMVDEVLPSSKHSFDVMVIVCWVVAAKFNETNVQEHALKLIRNIIYDSIA